MECRITKIKESVTDNTLSKLYELPAELESYFSKLSFSPTLKQRKAWLDFYNVLLETEQWNSVKLFYPMWGNVNDCSHGVIGGDILIPNGATSGQGLNLRLAETDLQLPTFEYYSTSRMTAGFVIDTLNTDTKVISPGLMIGFMNSNNYSQFAHGNKTIALPRYTQVKGSVVLAANGNQQMIILNGDTAGLLEEEPPMNKGYSLKISNTSPVMQLFILISKSNNDSTIITESNAKKISTALNELSKVLFVK